MNIISFIFLFLFITPVAMAQDDPVAPECRLLPNHVANDNVAYKAGVDVRGKNVVPADLNASQIELPETIVVPLSINLGQNTDINGTDLKATTGFLEIYKNGRVTYDGKDVTSQVYAICGQATQSSQKSNNQNNESME